MCRPFILLFVRSGSVIRKKSEGALKKGIYCFRRAREGLFNVLLARSSFLMEPENPDISSLPPQIISQSLHCPPPPRSQLRSHSFVITGIPINSQPSGRL
uniref:Uncharacterized protein n=1 Tax=Lygus hesperus TaxID=30085 RepID=A0A0K8TG80_LYGHE